MYRRCREGEIALKEQQRLNVIRALIVEFVGTFALIFVGAGAIIATAIGTGYSIGGAFLAEAIMTFFLMFVVFGTAVDERGPARLLALRSVSRSRWTSSSGAA
ncbi:MAG: hypothetical protein M3Y58_02725 [Chloroflexota bacterium]|nr:hypothetical protein [Chloroflexota bacterium]